MNPQERESWIWGWINQRAHQCAPFGYKLVVLAAKRNNAHFWGAACKAADLVTLQSRTVDDKTCSICAACGFQHAFHIAGSYSDHLRIGTNLAACSDDHLRVFGADEAIVGYPRTRNL